MPNWLECSFEPLTMRPANCTHANRYFRKTNTIQRHFCCGFLSPLRLYAWKWSVEVAEREIFWDLTMLDKKKKLVSDARHDMMNNTALWRPACVIFCNFSPADHARFCVQFYFPTTTVNQLLKHDIGSDVMWRNSAWLPRCVQRYAPEM